MKNVVRQRMRVERYVPSKLYGFAINENARQFFFHMKVFRWGNFQTTPPPIVGEIVDVEFDDNAQLNGHATRAISVWRVNEPVPSYGTVEVFNEATGYGFILANDGKSYYLHRSEMAEGIPLVGATVTFFEGFKNGRERACYVTLNKDTR